MTPAKLLTGEPTAVETQAIRKLLQKVRQVRILNRYEYWTGKRNVPKTGND